MASPILPPGFADAEHLGRRLVLVRREHDAKGRDHRIEAAVGERQRLGVGFPELDVQPLGHGAFAAAFEQRRYVIGRGHLAPPARRRQCRVAVAGRDIEHLAAGTQLHRLAQLFADDL